ncbi:MAG: hypothetical protein ABIJ00_04610 [Candidatus Eisenbacteria bacterium]
MSRIRPRDVMLGSLVLISLASFAGCGGLELSSVWRDREVKIDGIPTEWQGTTTYVEDSSVAVGIMNDDDYLYVSLSTSLRSVAAQIMARGLTVWLDPEGGKQKSFGIRCPIGAPQEMDDPSQFSKITQDRDKFTDMILEKLESSVEQLEIIGPTEDDVIRLFPSQLAGLEVRLGHQDGRFLYEVKIPLRSTDQHPYSIGMDEGSYVGLGFETAEIDQDKMREATGGKMPRGAVPGGDMPGRGPGGGGKRGGGMRGGGMGGGREPGGDSRIMPERLELWTKVKLASAD